ncbi:hypothetical protein ZWY2020_045892 [Hordeum vulgare]|nr:hypothetical protein ZWY2020_045892 [Hordeum vulgare]
MGLVDEKPPVAAAASTMEPVVPGADAGGHESIVPMADEPNWDDLPHDLVSKVADILLRCDVTEYLRMRAVKPWKDAVMAPELMGMDPRFFPRHWKMLVKAQGEEQARFVNVLTGASILVKIPRVYGQILACAEGCLLFSTPTERGTRKLHLFNPVTGAVAGLPTLLTAPISQDYKAAGIIYDVHDGEAPTPTVVVLVAVCSIDMVLYAKPGDTMWQWKFFGELPLSEADGGLSLGGSFYVPTRSGDVLKLELQPQAHFVYAARQQEPADPARHLNLSSYLVPSTDAGMLLVVRRFESHAGYLPIRHAVFQVNLTEGTVTILQDHKDIGKRSIFLRWLSARAQ